MKKLLLTLSTPLLFLGCTPTSTTATELTPKNTHMMTNIQPKKEALLVGVADYKDKKSDLMGIDIDIENMKAFYTKLGFNVTVLWNAESLKLGNYLEQYVHTLSKNDTFAFYYSGHGGTTPDKNGDEHDGQDETLVLSDGQSNQYFLDDNLYGYLNEIRAKKFVVFDSCHSGTAFKTFGNKPKPKTVISKSVDGVIQTKAFAPRKSQLNSGEYVILAAAQDNESALATNQGSLFTNALSKQLNSQGVTTGLSELNNNVMQEIINRCSISGSTAHHPKLSVSHGNLKQTNVQDFLTTTPVPAPAPQPIPSIAHPKKLSIYADQHLREYELLRFKLDTHGTQGYVTLFSILNGKVEVMYQSKEMRRGVLSFPEDFGINPPIEAYKSCGNCPEEVSRLYAVLSTRPVNVRIDQGKSTGYPFSIEEIGKTKAFGQRPAQRDFKPIITTFDFTIQ